MVNSILFILVGFGLVVDRAIAARFFSYASRMPNLAESLFFRGRPTRCSRGNDLGKLIPALDQNSLIGRFSHFRIWEIPHKTGKGAEALRVARLAFGVWRSARMNVRTLDTVDACFGRGMSNLTRLERRG
jgi:hypothetical protein